MKVGISDGAAAGTTKYQPTSGRQALRGHQASKTIQSSTLCGTLRVHRGSKNRLSEKKADSITNQPSILNFYVYPLFCQ